MSNCDQYQAVLLFVEQTQDEISKVFEKGAHEQKSELPLKKCNDEVFKDCNDSKDEVEDIYDILNEQLHDIELQISQLIAKKKVNEGLNDDYNGYNDFSYINTKNFNDNLFTNIIETDILSEHSLNSEGHIIDACTQTSPSLSPSSTNLTWPTECSSSPCLTSTSDSDLLDEDAQSTSSTDGRELIYNMNQRSGKVLNVKSSSAPMLKKIPLKMSKQTRSQSDRHLAEIEAEEACKWLRATGFPQYAQMYEDMQFPIDIQTAGQDHPLLEEDVLNSLFRRLKILNNCAHLHHQQRITTHTDESEDECCALSDNWTYQSQTRRWSRTCKTMQAVSAGPEESTTAEPKEKDDVFDIATFVARERPRRPASSKFRRRGLFFSDRDSVHDSDFTQLSELKACEVNHVSDSEITPTHLRRSRAKSFDKSETWSLPNSQTPSLWSKTEIPEVVPASADTDEPLTISGPPMSHLTCIQLQVLHKLALLKLTAHIEKYCPAQRTGWNWELTKYIRKKKTPNYKDKHVFGVPLTVTLQRTGQILPKNIEEALRWLQTNATDQVGIFRKPGVKSRIQALRNIVESSQENVNYNEHQHFDVADMVKQYFRELPDALLTNKFSETFILIFQYVPKQYRREAILCSLLLMPDEHIEVLQALLYFLQQVAKESSVNQMNETNLSMCFAPSLFHYTQCFSKQNAGSPHPKEIAENRAGHECLAYFLMNYDNLFNLPKEFLAQCEGKHTKVATLSELGKEFGGYQGFLNECEQNFLKEVKDKNRGYVSISGHNPKVEISYKKVMDGIPLKLWKVTAEIEAPPTEILNRILYGRHIWDPELDFTRLIQRVDDRTEVFQFIRRSISPLPKEEYCVLRTWRTDLPKEACLVIETSVEHGDCINIPNTVRGNVYASRYLIEPCGSGKSRIVHLSRVDTMGRSPDWYQNNYGHLCAFFISNLMNSFSQHASGPESKV
ncbi:stAR-related lipid transfer protein 13 [Aethina tumida]|uniref:stAR-related lipid transfer protein 13 n=1 Tax=Aethina tumida TaxID=116153 RepID=UPI00214791EF|nr:stAR-related lipid transfer protein 13 [Aethina tumida]